MGCGVGVGVMVGMGVDSAVIVVDIGIDVLPMSTAHPTNSRPSPAVATKRSSSSLVRVIGLLFGTGC
jgi:hypothetical protein